MSRKDDTCEQDTKIKLTECLQDTDRYPTEQVSEPNVSSRENLNKAGKKGSEKSFDSLARSDVPELPTLSANVAERWILLEKLGEGGMSAVYKARHRVTKQLAAIKILLPQHSARPESLKRFEAEAKAISKLDHPHIIGLNDCGANPDGQVFVIMDFASGESLSQILERDGIVETGRALKIFLQVAAALSHAHKRGIIHRDLKPSNVMLVEGQDHPDYVKIVDFGIAKLIHSPADANEESQRLTATGEVFGSPLYMSPEQYQGRVPDERSDVYSMGCLMYEAVTGSAPFVGKNALETLYKHVSEQPKPIIISPDADQALRQLERAILKCLAKHPNDRYQSMEELFADLEKIETNQPVSIRPVYRTEKRKSFGLVQYALFALIAIVGASGWLLSRTPAVVEPTPTFDEVASAPEAAEQEFDGKTLEMYDRQIEADPRDAQLYFDRGVLYLYVRDEPSNAVKDFTKAVQLNPQFAAPAYASRATAYAMMNKFDLAMTDANKSIELEPKWAGGYAGRAHVENLLEQFDLAAKDAENAVKISRETYGESPSISDELAFAKNGLEDYASARDWYTTGIDLSPTAFGYSMRGLAKFHLRDFDGAIADTNEALAISPTQPTARMVLAYALAAQNNIEAAKVEMDKGLAEDTFPARGHRLKGELFRYLGQFQKAISEYGKAISLEPDFYPGYRQRAIAYYRAGELKNALEDLQQSVNLNPKSSLSLSYLALIEELLGKTTDADDHIVQASVLGTTNSEFYSNLAAIQLHRRDFDNAILNASRALNINMYNGDAYHVRGAAQHESGKSAEARQDFLKADLYNYPGSTPQIGW